MTEGLSGSHSSLRGRLDCVGLTACLHVGKPTLPTSLAGDVQEDWSSSLIVGIVKEVSLLKSGIGMWRISRIVREVINLE